MAVELEYFKLHIKVIEKYTLLNLFINLLNSPISTGMGVLSVLGSFMLL